MAYTVEFSKTSSWNAGFVGSIVVKNVSPSPANGWVVEFDAPFNITNLWNGEILSHVGTHYVVRNLAWNANIPPNGTVTFGFQAATTDPAAALAGFTVNGQAVGGQVPALPSLSVTDVTLAEGDTGTAQAVFEVRLSAASTETVSVRYETTPGTAQAGTDFQAASGTLTFAPGETTTRVSIPVLGDRTAEPAETFALTLTDPVKATIADAQGAATILNDDVPTLSVADASAQESASGAKAVTFTVTLSAPAPGPVQVSYQTQNGTALSNLDYAGVAGTLVFNPGETSKTIAVPVIADALVEPTETFTLMLLAPVGATLARSAALGSIHDDRAPARPTLSVADLSLDEGNPTTVGGGASVGAGFFHTQGSQILDEAGHPVKIAGVNWFGMESDRFAPDGMHVRNYKDMMDQMADLGFNTIRLPFSQQLFEAGSRPNGIDYAKNPDLAGLSGLQIMDKIVAYAGEIGLKIILDHHRSSAGAGASENGLWYNGTYSEQRWIDTWTMLAQRYAGNATVIGADLHNEPYNGTWGGGGPTDWAAAAERAGNAILAANPNWLIFVEGVASYQGQPYWWGGNLMGVKDRPIQLNLPGHVVYAPHDYPNSVYGQPWFNDPSFPNNLPAKFDQMWGYIARENIAPVYLGEFGSRLTDPKDVAWLSKLTAYLAGDYDANGVRDLAAGQQGISWTWWSWNPNSGDTGGILQDNWTTVQSEKLARLQPLMFDFEAGGTTTQDGVTTALFQVTLSAAAAEAVAVDYTTAPGTADTSDFTPVTGTVTFAPGETVKTVAVAVRGDGVQEAAETFQLLLSNPRNAVVADAAATATIRNDDGATTPPTNPTPPPPTQPPTGAASLAFSTTVVSDWGSGFVASVTLKNTGAGALDDWTVQLRSPATITNIWNAEIVSHVGDVYTIHSAAWNRHLNPGQEISLGFQASGQAGLGTFEWLL